MFDVIFLLKHSVLYKCIGIDGCETRSSHSILTEPNDVGADKNDINIFSRGEEFMANFSVK